MKRYPLACLLMRLLVWLPVALSLSACKQEDPSPLERLPAATTTGANTWGCLVNGQAWTTSGAENMRADWTISNSCYCNMSFSRNSVTLGIQSIFLPVNYFLTSDPTGAHARLQIFRDFYEYDQVISGQLNLTRLDRQAGVMAGTFEFTIVGDAGDTLRVTDGRFDIGNMDR